MLLDVRNGKSQAQSGGVRGLFSNGGSILSL